MEEDIQDTQIAAVCTLQEWEKWYAYHESDQNLEGPGKSQHVLETQ